MPSNDKEVFDEARSSRVSEPSEFISSTSIIFVPQNDWLPLLVPIVSVGSVISIWIEVPVSTGT